MKISRSEYQTQLDIIEGFKPRYLAKRNRGGLKAVTLILWLLIGFVMPFSLFGIASQYQQTQCHQKALDVAGNVGTDHYYSELEKCSK